MHLPLLYAHCSEATPETKRITAEVEMDELSTGIDACRLDQVGKGRDSILGQSEQGPPSGHEI
jgi:hypothetical protein